MGSHLFTSRSGSNLGIRMRTKLTYLYTKEELQRLILTSWKLYSIADWLCALLCSSGHCYDILCIQMYQLNIFIVTNTHTFNSGIILQYNIPLKTVSIFLFGFQILLANYQIC
jgi:hypothetical protein